MAAPTILQTIADAARQRVAADQRQISAEEMQARALAMPKSQHRFFKALSRQGTAFICEVKKASPSKGIIDPVFDYKQIAASYEAAGADCISCLTEPQWFLGSDEIFTTIRQIVSIPMIRKDFTVDDYQIYQAKCMGADAVLLICALMENDDKLRHYMTICNQLGLDALVETHDEEEIAMAVRCGAVIIGVNNRNLKDFSVDFHNAANLRHLIPDNAIYVAESGVTSAEDVAALTKIGADAVLMGEVLMRAEDKKDMLARMREAVYDKNKNLRTVP